MLAAYDNPVDEHENDEITAVVEAVGGAGDTLGYIFNVTTAKGYGGDISLDRRYSG